MIAINNNNAPITRYKVIDALITNYCIDTYGHETGDSVLKEIATLLKTLLREVDTIARWGGEEFIVMMPHTDLDGASIPASRILKSIADRIFDKIPDEHITVSIGLACSGEKNSPDILVNAADLAPYKAKKKAEIG